MATNSQDSYLSFLTQSHTTALSQIVLPSISAWLKLNRGCDVSANELLAALKIEPSATFTVSAPINALIPPPSKFWEWKKESCR